MRAIKPKRSIGGLVEPVNVALLVWLGGFLVYVPIARSRAGLRFGERAHRAHGAPALWWAMTHSVIGLAWPISVAVWFARGRPPAGTRFRD